MTKPTVSMNGLQYRCVVTNACGAATSIAATLNIKKADQTITVVTASPASAVYNMGFTVAATASSGLAVSYGSAAPLSNMGADYTMNSGTGTGKVIYSQAGNDNYNAAPVVEVEVAANKADATIVVNGYEGTYDGSAHGATGTATGVQNEDLSSLLDLDASFTNAPGGTANWRFAGNGNYNADNGSVGITIGKAASVTTVTITGAPFTYTGSEIEPATVSVTGAGGVVLSTPPAAYADNVNAGTATASYSFTGDANHTGSSDSQAFTISKKSISVTPNANQSKVYGSTDPVFTFTPSEALLPGNSFTGTLGREAGETVAGGPYAYTLGNLAAGSNYSLALATTANKFDISAKAITGTFTAKNKMFDGNNAATVLTRSLEGVIGSDVVSLTGGSATFADASPGEAKVVTLAGATLSGTGANNYNIVSVATTTATIYQTPAVLLNPVASTEVSKTIGVTGNYTGIVKSPVWVWSYSASTTEGGIDETNQTISGSSNAPAASGMYTVYLKYTNAMDEPQQTPAVFVPVYDLNGGFVTGGGWINSASGAVRTSDYGLVSNTAGKATYAILSKYTKKGSQNILEGHTEFHFNVGNLKFQSTSFENLSLVINSDKATYKGIGMLNGHSGFKFTVIVSDGDKKVPVQPDKFRIRIWDSGDNLVYDNVIGALNEEDYTEPGDCIGGGNIVIHEAVKEVSGGSNSKKLTAEVTPELTKTIQFYNYPNTFSDRTTIVFSVDKEQTYLVEVYDVKGSLVKKVDMGVAEANKLYEFELDSRNMPEGIYFGRLTTTSGVQTIKMVLKK
ncbi:YDG domain-containing protein [Botryobacter ruber]|uniref:YDG domain-containing protein n=1 Tax=Botryobacter ruber TaxID=2171629 RepID=UPI000FEC9B7C|nr:YDG domain-containing protein [Botryobacter ruber]